MLGGSESQWVNPERSEGGSHLSVPMLCPRTWPAHRFEALPRSFGTRLSALRIQARLVQTEPAEEINSDTAWPPDTGIERCATLAPRAQQRRRGPAATIRMTNTRALMIITTQRSGATRIESHRKSDETINWISG